MNADPLGEPAGRADDDVLARLASIDHRLLQISTRLTTLGALLSHFEEIRTHLDILLGSLGSAGRS